VGLDFQEGYVGFSLDGFFRRGRNLIDWTRTSTTDPWQVTNLGRVDFKGIDFVSRIKPHINYKDLNLEQITFSYTYTEADKKTEGFLSKYALDILKHKFILSIDHSLSGLSLAWQLSYQERYYGEMYFVGNVYMAKKIAGRNFILEPFIKIDNFTDTKYSEVGGVLQPGRWAKTGLKWEW
jgi:iron complex outermembrane receptor protein